MENYGVGVAHYFNHFPKENTTTLHYSLFTLHSNSYFSLCEKYEFAALVVRRGGKPQHIVAIQKSRPKFSKNLQNIR